MVFVLFGVDATLMGAEFENFVRLTKTLNVVSKYQIIVILKAFFEK